MSTQDVGGASEMSGVHPVHPFYWSMRRELWEHRSIYLAPLAVALVVLLSALVHTLRIPEGAIPFHRLTEVSPTYLRFASISLYSVVSGILAATAALVGWFYCLDALHGERRERSVLFFRSLPVSDATTVLSKAIVGIGLVPLIALVIGAALYFVLLSIASIVLAANGVSAALLLGHTGFGETLVIHLYLAVAAILWSSPLFAWAIFVSSWARRATLLWALLPPAALGLAEVLAFRTHHVWDMLGERFSGGLRYAFTESAGAFDRQEFRLEPEHFPDSLLTLLDPLRFLSQPGLWLGLLVAAGLIVASIWMRRYRESL